MIINKNWDAEKYGVFLGQQNTNATSHSDCFPGSTSCWGQSLPSWLQHQVHFSLWSLWPLLTPATSHSDSPPPTKFSCIGGLQIAASLSCGLNERPCLPCWTSSLWRGKLYLRDKICSISILCSTLNIDVWNTRYKNGKQGKRKGIFINYHKGWKFLMTPSLTKY